MKKAALVTLILFSSHAASAQTLLPISIPPSPVAYKEEITQRVFGMDVTTSSSAIGMRTTGAGAESTYPVLFVHGYASSDTTWEKTLLYLQSLGWGKPFTYHFNLNADFTSTDLLDDLEWALPVAYRDVSVPFTSMYAGTRLFTVNFATSFETATSSIYVYDRHEQDLQSESNEAAVTKQGLALSLAIAHVLEITGASKVILVGHSMGGLAIREYLQRVEGGQRAWWVDPTDDRLGHKVARVVTYGTPHQGTNVSYFGLASLKFDLQTEAVRDVRWTYLTSGSGRYLFGGTEAGLDFFYNADVNCDGDANDSIIGINDGDPIYEVSIDNPLMPLPPGIDYVWIASNFTGWGDYVVDFHRQMLIKQHADGTFSIAPESARWIQSDVSHGDQTADFATITDALLLPSTVDSEYPQRSTSSLSQNYPNPFSNETTIDFSIGQTSHVEIVVYDILGREVVRLKDGLLTEGTYLVKWDGRDKSGHRLSSGSYLYTFRTADGATTTRMAVIQR